jgi:alcohol dehydrogenase
MKAALYDNFLEPLTIRNVPDPEPDPDGVVIRVEASGICRSDWHGWQGHDPDITPPHVPGHEMAGLVEAAGRDVSRWKRGDRVTLPFCCGCGECPPCREGHLHLCDHSFQPGFTHWGSFAEYCAVRYADANLVRIPDEVDFVTAAALGCRFVTSFRAVVDQGRTTAGEWVAVHGCGGVGLSAVMIAVAVGAKVVAVDIDEDKLRFARALGAAAVVNARSAGDVASAVADTTGGGAHVSIDALGSVETCRNSIQCLRKRGRHVQVGLLVADESDAPVPMYRVLSRELEVVGSYGMPANHYERVMEMIVDGRLQPQQLIGKKVTLEDASAELEAMGRFGGTGIAVINDFSP